MQRLERGPNERSCASKDDDEGPDAGLHRLSNACGGSRAFPNFFEDIYSDHERLNETTMLTTDLGDESLDVDSIDASLEWSADRRHAVIEAAVQSFKGFLDRNQSVLQRHCITEALKVHRHEVFLN